MTLAIRTNPTRSILAAGIIIAASGCADGLSGEQAEAHLTAQILLPDEGETLQDPAVDDSIELGGSAGAGGMPSAVMPGEMVTVSIPFNAPNGNVVAAGIRFGANGPIRTVPVGGAQGQTSGTLQFQMQVPPSVCGDLSQICHDIKCYEFAVTDAGRVSRANINSIAMACGDCDEPSCADLLMCDDDICSPTQTLCPGVTLDFCSSMSGDRCAYRAAGRRFDCGDCRNAGAIQSCANDAANALINACR